MNATKFYTINDIEQEMTRAGSHWWDKSTMRFFRCRVGAEVYQGTGGIYFVTSERCSDDHKRLFSVRKYDPATKEVDTIGDFNSMTRGKAHRLAKELAGDAIQIAAEPLRKRSDSQQLAHDIQNGGGIANPTSAQWLIRLASKHQRIMVDYCNGIDPYDDDGEPGEELTKVRKAITDAATQHNCGVMFSGDPRGATVKLILPSGKSNSMGGEGWCVPTKD